jgi:amidase
MSGLTVEHVVARSVRDVASALDATHGPAPGDPYVAPPPTRPYAEELGADPGSLRIAIVTDPIGAPHIEIDPVVVAATRKAATLLESLGHSLDEDGPAVDGLDLTDAVLTRWYAGVSEIIDQLGVILGRPLTAEDMEPLTWVMAEEGSRRHAGQYLVAVRQHQAIGRMLGMWFEAGHDLLLTPTMGELPPPLGTFPDDLEDPLRRIHRGKKTVAFTALFNATGNPAISLPLASSDVLPVGVQLVAPLGREDVLLRVASQLEAEQPWADRVPRTLAGSNGLHKSIRKREAPLLRRA